MPQRIKKKMTITEFMATQTVYPATHSWTWCFANHDKKQIFFTAWTDNETDQGVRILGNGKKWKYDSDGEVNPRYRDILKHIRLVINHGYSARLLMQVAPNPDERFRKVDQFSEICKIVDLKARSDGWYASYK